MRPRESPQIRRGCCKHNCLLACVCQWQCSIRAHDSDHRDRRACSDGPLVVYVLFHYIARHIRMPVAYDSYQGILAPLCSGLLRKMVKYSSYLLGSPNRIFIPYCFVLLLVSLWVACGVCRCSVGGHVHCCYVRLCLCSPISPCLLWLGQWSPSGSSQNASCHGTVVFSMND